MNKNVLLEKEGVKGKSKCKSEQKQGKVSHAERSGCSACVDISLKDVKVCIALVGVQACPGVQGDPSLLPGLLK